MGGSNPDYARDRPNFACRAWARMGKNGQKSFFPVRSFLNSLKCVWFGMFFHVLIYFLLVCYQPLGKEPFRRWEPFGIHNSSGFPNRIPAISLKNVQVGAVPSSTVYLQPL